MCACCRRLLYDKIILLLGAKHKNVPVFCSSFNFINHDEGPNLHSDVK